jgi:hypothetical protein
MSQENVEWQLNRKVMLNHHELKAYGGLHAFIVMALDGGEWSASRLSRFIPGRKSLLYPLDYTEIWIDAIADVDMVTKHKIHMENGTLLV